MNISQKKDRMSLVVKWVRPQASTTGGMCLMPGQGSSTCGQLKEKE